MQAMKVASLFLLEENEISKLKYSLEPLMIRLLFFFLLGYPSFGQKQTFHLLIASDVKDVKYGVNTYSKIEKINQTFNLVTKSLNYSLKHKYWYEQSFTSSAVADYLKDSLRKIDKNDIVVFYYLGRGQNDINKSLAELHFRDPQKKMSVQSVEDYLKNKGRLTMLIVDCYEPFPKSRALFQEPDIVQTLKQDLRTEDLDSLESIAVKRNLAKISESEWLTYSLVKDSLNYIFKNYVANNNDSEFEKEKVLMILKRLSMYPKDGFPDPKRSLKRKFDILPDLSVKYTANRDFSCVIDSLYKKNTLLRFDDPLHIYLDTLIKIPPYDIKGRPAIVAESFNEYVIRKVFFTNCGNFVVSNKLNNSSQNIDYTSSFYKNLSELVNVNDTKSINKLEIKDLLLPSKLDPQIKISNKNCPEAPRSEIFYLPQRIYSVAEIESRFRDFYSTKDQLLKNKITLEILELFEKNAKITIKYKEGRQEVVLLAEYLNSNKNNSFKNISIPFQRIKRNSNYTQITTLLIVES
jgi:hypothetical protein